VNRLFDVFKCPSLVTALAEKVSALSSAVSVVDVEQQDLKDMVKKQKELLDELVDQNRKLLESVKSMEEKLKKVDIETKHNLRRIKDARTVASQRDMLYYELTLTNCNNSEGDGL